MFDLTPRDFKLLMQIIHEHKNEFRRVILFGSRARGDSQKHSDIDLAILFHAKNPVLKANFEESKLSLSVDVVDLSLEKDTPLSNFIQKEGVVLYDEEDRTIGEHWMTMALLREKLTDYQNALAKLNEALTKNIEADDLYLDGTIQRFEFTYELAWKLMKAYLHHLGIEANNPRSVFRESIKQEIISDDQNWFDMIDKRNDSTHTYHHEIALAVYSTIKSNFIRLFTGFSDSISKKIL